MLDLVAAFTYGGRILWSYKPEFSMLGSEREPVNALISNILIEGREAESKEYAHGAYALKWVVDNKNDLICVAIIQKQLAGQLGYMDDLLARTHRRFVAQYKADLIGKRYMGMGAFTAEFKTIHAQCEQLARENVCVSGPKVMGGFESGVKAQKLREKSLKTRPTESEASAEPSPPRSGAADDSDDIDANRRRFLERQRTKGKGGSFAKKPPAPVPAGVETLPEKKGKEKREWAGENAKGTSKGLDFSGSSLADKHAREAEDAARYLAGIEATDMHGDIRDLTYSDVGEDQDPDLDSEDKPKGFFGSFLDGITGNKVITETDLVSPLRKYQEHLVSKNVAENVATDICAALNQSLVGTKMSTLRGINKVIEDTLQQTLSRILTPNRRVDILRDAMDAKAKGRPYVITFCGVNGVGKSTNLAKVAYWLLQNDLSILIAACDTFRAGAVEQLRVHQAALRQTVPDPGRLELYEKGYGKDAAAIAMEAIRFAKESGKDVVLVDTAGRMQNNEPLMRSLAKLVHINQPDLVVFVGEALVGNEAVDQLSKFNQAMVDYAVDGKPRTIDGIILSKFDTIDDKVGAAISMTYTTGQPVLFVGVGQTYTDLRKLNVKTVVQSLLR